MKSKIYFLMLVVMGAGLASCKEVAISADPSATTYTFTSSTAYSFAGTGTYNLSFANSLPAATAHSLFSLTQTGVLLAANRVEDTATGFTVPSTLGQPADGSYTAGYSAASSSIKRELILFRSTNSNLELYSATRTSTNNAVSFSRKTLIAAQASNVVSMTETADGEYILLVSSSGTHKIIKRGFDGDDLADTFSVTASSVGSTISVGRKALTANLNNSSDTGDNRNEYEFLLVGNSSVRVLIPSGTTGLYTDSAAVTRSGTAQIVDAAMVRWDADQFPDLLLLTTTGIEYYKNNSTANGAIAFASGRDLIGSTIEMGTPTKFLVSDLNGDQFQDLIVLRQGDDPLYLQFSANFLLTDKSASGFGSALTSDFTDAASGDFNGDNRTDIAFFESDGTVTTFLAGN